MPTEKPDGWDELDEGTRSDAQVADGTERHYIVADGKKYWFDICEPTWKKTNAIISDALTIGEDGTDIAVDEYYLDILEYMIEDMSVDGDNVRMFLIGVNAELGEKLEGLAPNPGQGLSEDEEGNSDEPSGGSTQAGSQTQA